MKNIYYVCQSYWKRYKKALGKARKSGAEGVGLKLLKESALFFRFERDILADGAQVIGRDAEKRGEVLQGKMLNNTGTTLQQQLIAFAGCGTMEVEVAGAGLTE